MLGSAKICATKAAASLAAVKVEISGTGSASSVLAMMAGASFQELLALAPESFQTYFHLKCFADQRKVLAFA
jgi:hypothetical protein